MSLRDDAFPTALSAGYRMPPEWAPHSRCWMAWPCRLDFWGQHLDAARQDYATVANSIAAFEPVTMLVTAREHDLARSICSAAVEILVTELDDSWTRDSGPNFVQDANGNLAASIFQFNAWGGKHRPWQRDAAIGHRIAEYLGIPTFTAPLFMEGGGINVDGEGTVLASTQNVLNDNRNPGLSQEEASQLLCNALGASKVVWFPGDPDDTETDGHIDGIAAFVGPGKVVVEVCPAKGTARHDNTYANVAAVSGQCDARGHELEVVLIEEAYEADRPNDIFASSYVNFYLANGAVIMPAFGIDRDQEARQTLASLFPDREIVQVDITGVASGGGGIHCITQQQPA